MRHLMLGLVFAVSACTKEGPAGPAGARGEKGDPGAPGMNGMDGMNGIDGMNGVPGMNGTNGVDGMPGAQGMQGAQGVPGMNGTNGDLTQIYARTIVVKSGGTPAANGTALSSALAALSPAPSLTTPWRVVLEPGEYSVASTLKLDYLAVEGAGSQMTFITGSPATSAVVSATGNTLVRSLHIRRSSSGVAGPVLLLGLPQSGFAQFRDVYVSSNGGTASGNAASVYVEQTDGSAVFQDCFIGGFQDGPTPVTAYRRTAGTTVLDRVDVFLGMAQSPPLTGLVFEGGGSSGATLRNVTLTLISGPVTPSVDGVVVRCPTTASGLEVKLQGGSIAGGTYRAVTTAGIAGAFEHHFDHLRLTTLLSAGTLMGFAHQGPGFVVLRHPYITDFTNGFTSAAGNSSRLYFGVVSGTAGGAGTETCAGLVNATGGAVTCL